jgi:hypothetical protein
MKTIWAMTLLMLMSATALAQKEHRVVELNVTDPNGYTLMNNDLVVSVDENNRLNSVYIEYYPEEGVALKPLETSGKKRVVKISKYGFTLGKFESRNFSLTKGGDFKIIFPAVKGSINNYSFKLVFNKQAKRWQLLKNKAIVSSLDLKLNKGLEGSMVSLLFSPPKVASSNVNNMGCDSMRRYVRDTGDISPFHSMKCENKLWNSVGQEYMRTNAPNVYSRYYNYPSNSVSQEEKTRVYKNVQSFLAKDPSRYIAKSMLELAVKKGHLGISKIILGKYPEMAQEVAGQSCRNFVQYKMTGEKKGKTHFSNLAKQFRELLEQNGADYSLAKGCYANAFANINTNDFSSPRALANHYQTVIEHISTELSAPSENAALALYNRLHWSIGGIEKYQASMQEVFGALIDLGADIDNIEGQIVEEYDEEKDQYVVVRQNETLRDDLLELNFLN